MIKIILSWFGSINILLEFDMKKRLAERIRIEKKSAGKKHKNLSIIVSLLDEIQESLDAGWSRFAIWEQLKKEGIYKSGFQSFLYNLSKLINNAEYQQTKENKPDQSKTEEDQKKGPIIAKCPDDGKKFKWDSVKKDIKD